MTLINYHIVLTVLLVMAFAAMTVWVFWPSRRTQYQQIAQRILNDSLDEKTTEERKGDE
ncbi:MAG: cbb3-type cytochrome c oxidase subunit 3 [Alcanivorax sp.]|nr:cbb3-type cytochrome c oxidase subunit 3 [Alcanivorax sp.]